MDKYTRTIKDKGNSKLRKVTLTAFRGLVKRSPVDTARFRGNWMGSVGGPDLTVNLEGQQEAERTVIKLGSPTTGREASNIAPALQAKIGEDVYISNSIEYGPGLEAGTGSPQAPHGMLHITARQIQAALDK